MFISIARQPSLSLIAGLALACAWPVHAQDAGTAPKEIKVQEKKNPGHLPYAAMYELHARLMSYLPPEPRLFDPVNRISFTQLPLAEQDAYEPKDWAVSIVGETVDQVVPVRRGGYFELPHLPAAFQEKATLMFREQSQRNYLEEAWVMRIGPERRLSYADFGKAMDQLRAVQKRIPILRSLSYRVEKYGNFDGLKACFLAPGGTLRVDGAPAADRISGTCSVLKFDPARGGSGQVIEFDGPLDVVTLIRTESYLREKA